jgi:hypothetical protein
MLKITVKNILIVIICLLIPGIAASAAAALSTKEASSLFNQANDAFRQANSTADSQQAKSLYENAILLYEKIVTGGRIQNAKLYYNLGNAYLLKGSLGKAILNYRRAERLDAADENIRKNLAFARSRKIDQIKPKTEEQVVKTLFFWHYDFSIKTKFLLGCIFFAITCISLTALIWLGRKASLTAVVIISGILMLCFLVSVVVETKNQADTICGVITVPEVIAKQGDGQNYPPSFKAPLHEGTEFDLLEQRPAWLHIKLADDSDGWIPSSSAELI